MCFLRLLTACSIAHIMGDAPGARYQPLRVMASCDAPGHGHISVEHKVWIYECGRVCWELRRLLAEMFKGRPGIKFCAEIRRETPQWERFCEELSLQWRDLFNPSLLAFNALLSKLRLQGDAAQLEQARNGQRFVREEASVTTVGFLCVCLEWASHRRRQDDRLHAMAILHSLLASCVASDAWREWDFAQLLGEHTQECQYEVVDGVCSHVRATMLECQLVADLERSRACVQVLAALCRDLRVCKASRSAIVAALPAVAEMVEGNLERIGNNDIQSWSTMSSGGAKRRRHDEDYRRHLSVTMVRQGHSSSAGASARSHRVPEGTSRRWASIENEKYVGKCWEDIGEPLEGPVSICEDGARFGQPAKECQCYGLWSSEVGLGAWLPPQEPNQQRQCRWSILAPGRP